MAGPTRLMALEEVRVEIIAVRRVSRVRRVPNRDDECGSAVDSERKGPQQSNGGRVEKDALRHVVTLLITNSML